MFIKNKTKKTLLRFIFVVSILPLSIPLYSYSFQLEKLSKNLFTDMNPFSSDIFLSEEICVTKYNEISADNIYFPLTETTYNVTDAILPDNLFAAMALSDPDDPNNPGNDPISQAPVGNIPFLAVFIASLAYIAVKKRDKLSRKV